MPNTLNRPTVHAVTIERGGYTYLGLWSDESAHEQTLTEDESAAYYGGRLVPSCRPVRPVRCYEGARS